MRYLELGDEYVSKLHEKGIALDQCRIALRSLDSHQSLYGSRAGVPLNFYHGDACPGIKEILSFIGHILHFFGALENHDFPL